MGNPCHWRPDGDRRPVAGHPRQAAVCPGDPLGLWPVARKAWALTQSGSFAIETPDDGRRRGALFLGETAEAAAVLLLFMLGSIWNLRRRPRRAGVTALMALVPDKALRLRKTPLKGSCVKRWRPAAASRRPCRDRPGARLPPPMPCCSTRSGPSTRAP